MQPSLIDHACIELPWNAAVASTADRASESKSAEHLHRGTVPTLGAETVLDLFLDSFSLSQQYRLGEVPSPEQTLSQGVRPLVQHNCSHQIRPSD